MLIGAKYLDKEKEEAINEILTQEVQNYLKFHGYSRDDPTQAVKSFTDHLMKVYWSHLVTVGSGMFYSLYFIVRCSD